MEFNRRDFVKAGAYAALASATARADEREYKVGTYYFPNWHVDPRNEEVHGQGWTEWEILKRGEPKFPGHAQPKRPAWGFEDESDPSVFEKKLPRLMTRGSTISSSTGIGMKASHSWSGLSSEGTCAPETRRMFAFA